MKERLFTYDVYKRTEKCTLSMKRSFSSLRLSLHVRRVDSTRDEFFFKLLLVLFSFLLFSADIH